MTNPMMRAKQRRDDGDPGGAIVILRTALEQTPATVEVQVYLGALLAERGDHEAAAAVLERAVRSIPDAKQARIHSVLATSYDALGRTDDAIAACRSALACRSDLVPPSLLLGTLLAVRGEVDEALRLYRGLLGRITPEEQALVELGIANLERGGQLDGERR
ncbi:MAG: tetratricopeptide repeat protein [Cellulomonas sp.]|nr:tetratricopeptide repeat protein [Cellulomonas sp.]